MKESFATTATTGPTTKLGATNFLTLIRYLS